MSILLKKANVLENLVVSQGSLTKDLDMLDTEVRKALNSNKKGYGVVVSGYAGSGKTTLLDKFIENAEKLIDEGGHRPATIVSMETPPVPQGKDLFEAMLFAAGTPYEDFATLSKIKASHQKYEIQRLIKSKNIRVWVFDEFQHAAKRWGSEKAEDNANFLKSIINSSPVLIVFAGTHEVKRVAIKGQYDSRTKFIEKQRININSARAYQAYLDYLATLQSYTGVPGIEWDAPEIALPTFYESRGDLRKITDTFVTALTHADKLNGNKLQKKHFEESWTKRYFPAQGETIYFRGNTFKQPVVKLVDALGIDYDVE